jgi:pyruvate/2-oxoglutarate dehydrogenase complex dihydrolipoamide dehydrogenase (E3) component
MAAVSAAVRFDAIVIGSGQGGTPLSRALADAGLRTALVERAHVGGTCVNEGCTPTKTMIASARVAYLARRGADYGVTTGDVSVDLGRVQQRTREVVRSFRDGSERRLTRTANLELIFGEASFVDQTTLRVRLAGGGERAIAAPRIFINTGSRPAIPRIDGLADVPFLDSTSVMALTEVPEHLLVLGGGYVGVEFAQMYRRFGSRVTIINSGAQLLGREDADVAAAIAGILEEDGVALSLNGKAEAVSAQNERIRVRVRSADTTEIVVGSHLLVATGRTPNSDVLDVGAAGLETDRHGFIRVNERLETSVPGVYALGDINGGPAFTHISYDDFRILRTNVLENGSATTRDRPVPYVVYIDPQLGRVGMTEAEARAARQPVRVARMPMAHVARALELDESRGLMKVIVHRDTDRILGAAVLGIEGGEVMSILQIAMMGDLPFDALRDGVFAHPTLAESLNNLFMRFDENR